MSGSDKKISDEDSITIAKFIGFIFFFYIISQNFTLFFIFLIFSFLLYIFCMILKMFGLL